MSYESFYIPTYLYLYWLTQIKPTYQRYYEYYSNNKDYSTELNLLNFFWTSYFFLLYYFSEQTELDRNIKIFIYWYLRNVLSRHLNKNYDRGLYAKQKRITATISVHPPQFKATRFTYPNQVLFREQQPTLFLLKGNVTRA